MQYGQHQESTEFLVTAVFEGSIAPPPPIVPLHLILLLQQRSSHTKQYLREFSWKTDTHITHWETLVLILMGNFN